MCDGSYQSDDSDRFMPKNRNSNPGQVKWIYVEWKYGLLDFEFLYLREVFHVWCNNVIHMLRGKSLRRGRFETLPKHATTTSRHVSIGWPHDKEFWLFWYHNLSCKRSCHSAHVCDSRNVSPASWCAIMYRPTSYRLRVINFNPFRFPQSDTAVSSDPTPHSIFIS
jgi:hypothetical protein